MSCVSTGRVRRLSRGASVDSLFFFGGTEGTTSLTQQEADEIEVGTEAEIAAELLAIAEIDERNRTL